MKIPVDKRVRRYELTVLTPAGYTSTELKKAHEELTQLVVKFKGKVVVTDDWGEKDLAYPIRHGEKKQYKAHYTYFEIEIDPAQTADLEKSLQLNPLVMRSLLLIAKKPAADKEPVALKRSIKSEPAKKAEAVEAVAVVVEEEIKTV